MFGGDGRNRVLAADAGLLYSLRIAVTPFGAFDDNSEGDLDRKPEPRLMIGIAGAYNQNTLRARSTTGRVFVLVPYDYLHGAPTWC